jgi:hypothetical protein
VYPIPPSLSSSHSVPLSVTIVGTCNSYILKANSSYYFTCLLITTLRIIYNIILVSEYHYKNLIAPFLNELSYFTYFMQIIVFFSKKETRSNYNCTLDGPLQTFHIFVVGWGKNVKS